MKTEIFGVKFDDLTMNEALEKIQGFVALPYSEFIVKAQKDKEFRNILNSADFCFCESRGLYLAVKLTGKSLKNNINGIDLIYGLVKKPKTKILDSKLFLFGGREDVVKKTAQKLGDSVIGYEHGYQDEKGVVEKINLLKPNILLVGLGSPKQEKFIFENLKKMPSVKLAIGVGGAFDFISGRIKRAPKFMRKIGLEWLWRAIIEPKRIKRVFTGVFGLVFILIKGRIFH